MNRLRAVGLKWGDGLVLLLGMLICWGLAERLWQPAQAEQVIIRSVGKHFQTISLAKNLTITVPGHLGNSQIEIRDRRVRIAQDPSPRQYCVRQGWLKNAGEMAICLPNQVSIELIGGVKKYDSLNY